ncbi:type I restriction enzyme HsdR N-terminal domain-containing protein [Eudoraea sp.]|uniref:type I restriction enzyme HsdR N-terminal domain-containing protein n=1 Tax=Eudoraea sp. TaxID=1979955 RepID=UPI003C765A3C
MLALNFPTYQFRIKNSENTQQIFDIVRKKFVVLQPEEWVRQHTLQYLVYEKGYPLSLIGVEKMILLNGLKKRADILVYKPNGAIRLLIECKAPQIKITQLAFDQIARYNLKFEADYLMVTNGIEHYYCQMDYEKEKYTFLKQIPDFSR